MKVPLLENKKMGYQFGERERKVISVTITGSRQPCAFGDTFLSILIFFLNYGVQLLAGWRGGERNFKRGLPGLEGKQHNG